MAVTIKDIARLAGVSIATVSKVLNNKADGISAETKKKILNLAEDLGYRPNVLARGLVTKKSYTIGLILPDISNPFFAEIARGTEDIAKDRGYNLFLCNTDNDSSKEAEYIRVLRERQVEGIIFAASAFSNFQDLKEHVGNKPFVLVDRRPEELLDLPGVFLDNFKGGYLAAEHLIERGHRQIVFITGPLQSYNARQRLHGFFKAFEDLELEVNKNLVIEGDFKRKRGSQAVEELLAKGIEFTAVFASNDLMAVGVLEVLREKGIAVPSQVAVVGFDDIYLSKIITPKLTTISQPIYQMGAEAAKILVFCLNDEEIVQKQKIFIPKLIIRESS